MAIVLNGLDPLARLQQVVASLTEISAEARGVQDLLQRVVRETMRFTGATGAVVEQVDDDELVYVCADGSISGHVGLRLSRRGSLSGLATFSRQIQQCDDSETDPRVNREACRAIGARSMLIVPLLFGQRVIGVLKATSERVSAFGPLDRDALQYSAGIIAAALGREMRLEADRRVCTRLGRELDITREAAQQSRREARVDPLTGLPNRRQFEHWLDEALADDERCDHMGLMFLDLDAFKAVNDSHGHAVGDAALRRVAEILRTTLPTGFRAARLDGDEFVVLATNLDEAEAALTATAHTLLAAVEQPQPLAPDLALPLSVSIGGALCDSDTLDRGEWLRRADNAMYAAKTSGDNQFRLYGHR
ncbi:MAG: sensor domain-containing diguanylate cyclase [Lysobacter sp.]